VSTGIRDDEATSVRMVTERESLTVDTPEEEEEEVVDKLEGSATGEEGMEDPPSDDSPSATLSDADQMMNTVFGDHIHQNDGTHLDGDIVYNATWQDYWRWLVFCPNQPYQLPKGNVGK
jgi:hypothetical protein